MGDLFDTFCAMQLSLSKILKPTNIATFDIALKASVRNIICLIIIYFFRPSFKAILAIEFIAAFTFLDTIQADLIIAFGTFIFVTIFTDFVDQHNLKDNQFGLEVTETAELADLAVARESLQLLKSKGIKIALDDFGAGYASLKYVRELPIDVVKLDKHFTFNVSDPTTARLIGFVSEVCDDLNLEMIGEGIETEEENLSSATGRGIAYPHSKSIEIDGLVCVLGISQRGIDVNAPDGQNCHFILLTLIPNQGSVEHRKFINRFRAMINHGDIRTQFLDAKNTSQVLKVISQWETQETQEEFE